MILPTSALLKILSENFHFCEKLSARRKIVPEIKYLVPLCQFT